MKLAPFLVTLTLVSGCASGSPPPPHGEPEPAEPMTSRVAETESPPDAGPEPEVDAAPATLGKREGAPGDTRGTISCGSVRCKAPGEVCTSSETSWSCVPSAKASEQNGAVYACDDVSDCADGKQCCQTFASAQLYVSCEARDGNCAAELCESDASCPKGQTCDHGGCVAKRLPATCTGKKRCQSDKESICVWSRGQGQCASVERAERLRNDEASAFECTRPDDCGGWKCCTSMSIGLGATFCQSQCDLANSMQLCNANADCRAYANAVCGDSAECKKKARCVAASTRTDTSGITPPWMKVCSTD